MHVGEGIDVSSFSSIEAMEERFSAGHPLIVVFGPSYADAAGLKAVMGLNRHRADVGSLLVVDELDTQLLQQALRAGVRDVVELPADSVQFMEAIYRVVDSITTSVRAPGGDRLPEPHAEAGTVITVMSAKGGVGKSVVATNLAVTLARRAEGAVALVDADLQFGDVAVMLKLIPQRTILDAVGAIHRLDTLLLQSLLMRHDPSGLHVLAAPLEPAFADQVSPADMLTIVKLLQTFCQYVVVDTPADFNDVVSAVIEDGDEVLLVAAMDIPSIKNVKIGLPYLRLLNVPSSRIKLVLNRANSRVRLSVMDVERTLQLKADCLVPSEIVVPQSVNKGIPAVIEAPRSGVARSIEQLADMYLVAGR
jgi:pilus assembly protein CpaE